MSNRKRDRRLLLFGLTCFISSCDTPLVVPLLLALLAGSPLALWLGQYLGWVYGFLIVISILSFMLALQWKVQRNTIKAFTGVHVALSSSGRTGESSYVAD